MSDEEVQFGCSLVSESVGKAEAVEEPGAEYDGARGAAGVAYAL